MNSTQTLQLTVKLLQNLFPQETLQAALEMVQDNISKGRYVPLVPELSELVRTHYKAQLTLPEEGKEINIYTLLVYCLQLDTKESLLAIMGHTLKSPKSSKTIFRLSLDKNLGLIQILTPNISGMSLSMVLM